MEKVSIPKEPSSDEKSAFRGEFSIEVENSCSACDYDEPQDDCEVCFGEVTYTQRHSVPWDTIKEIRKALVNFHS